MTLAGHWEFRQGEQGQGGVGIELPSPMLMQRGSEMGQRGGLARTKCEFDFTIDFSDFSGASCLS